MKSTSNPKEHTMKTPMTRYARLVAVCGMLALSLFAASAKSAAAATLEFGTSGDCEQGIPAWPGTTSGQVPGIALTGTRVSLANSPNAQTVTRYLYLYRWNGGSWVYASVFNKSHTYLTPYSFPSNSTWFLDSGSITSNGEFLLPIPSYGSYYAATQQLTWTDNKTRQVIQTFWTGHLIPVLDFTNQLSNYCSFPTT